jgi:putative ABC transport system permease protein
MTLRSSLWSVVRRRRKHDPNRFAFQDLLVEAAAGVSVRPGRLVMTTLGTVLGIASLVATIGLAQTASGQISRSFSRVAGTEVTVKAASSTTDAGSRHLSSAIPWDAVARVRQVAGVTAAALLSPVDIGTSTVSSLAINDPSQPQRLSPPVLASSPGLVSALDGRISYGRFFDRGHDGRADRVAVVGKRAAAVLGIAQLDDQPTIAIGIHRYVVIGVIASVNRRADVLDSVVIPDGTARSDFGLSTPQELDLRIAPGAGPQVAHQAPIALDPNAPGGFAVASPSPPSTVQGDVQGDVNIIFLLLGLVVLLAGGLGIMNVTLLSVSERRGEIGLRRALGATERDIAAQFITESTVIGLLGGLIGAAVGVFAVTMVAAASGWTAIVDLRVVAGATVLGTVIGLAAGAYPAIRASRIEPVDALRAGV